MHWLARLFRKNQSEQQLDSELRFHLEKQIADSIAAGMPPEEARRRANLNFGGLESIKQQSRESRRAHFVETLFQDLRYAFRLLRKNPGFTLAAVITLALGIGANTAIFSIVNSVILRPLPYKNSSRMIEISAHSAMYPTFSLGISWINLRQIRAQASSLEQTAAYYQSDKTLTGTGEPAVLSIAFVTDGFFEELGVKPQLGLLLTQQDTHPGMDHVVVLSNSLWRSRFGSDPAILGKTLILDKQPYTVAGVAPPQFSFSSRVQAWLPIAPTAEEQQQPDFFMLNAIATLRGGESINKLNAQLDAIAQQTTKDYPALSAGFRFSTAPLLTERLGNSRDAFLILFAASSFVLLIACANLASLLLARGSARHREMALRSALGASRGRLLRQGLVESCLLALLGGALGVFLAIAGIQLFRSIAPADTPRLDEISLDSTLLWFSLLTSLFAGILFGIVPGRRASRLDPNEAIKEGTGSSLGSARSSRQSRLGNVLVSLEVALAFVLVVGSVLMTLTLSSLLHQNPGFRTDHLLSLDLPQPPVTSAAEIDTVIKRQVNLVQELVQKVRQIPGVSAVTVSDHGVLSGMMMMEANLLVDGAIPPSSKESRNANARYIYPGYFQMLGIPLLRGREFTDRDVQGTQRAVLVNAAMAREYWGTLDVLGKRISTSTDDKGGRQWNVVIGVVSDAREVNLRNRPSPTYFFSMLQGGTGGIHLLVRTQTDPSSLAATITREIWSGYPDQPVTHLQTMTQNISESLGNERLRSVLLTVFAAIGFALALVGVYGVISYSVARRVQEIGIRMALGAAPLDVFRMVIGQGLAPVALGILIGAAAAFGLTRFVSSELYGVQPTDPLTYAGATILVLLVAILACWIPARRASRVDPLLALRYE
ncbi:MAG TPA: ABC transporter permease [Candidatus Acidoferrum sp.]|nr:ABC transporter permease [Candidatus Acidoferrum sp.]